MGKRRGHNEGTIFQRDNGTWRAQVSVGGRRLSYTGPNGTRKECQEWLKKTLGQVDQGLSYDSARTALREFLEGWLASCKSSLAYSTHSHYDQVIRDFIIPALGRVKLKDLRPDHVQALYDRMIDDGNSGWQVQLVHRILNKSFEHAVTIGLLPSNPTRAVIVPKPEHREMQILTEAEVSRLLLQVKGHRNEALYYLAINTGMRQGELLGLRWEDIDWERKTVRVQRQVIYQKGKGFVFADLKTRYSRRTIPIGSTTCQKLRAHYDKQWLERQFAETRWKENGLVFPTSVGTPIRARNLQREFKIHLRGAALRPIRFHDLRHTAAALMLSRERQIIVVSRRLGHSRPSITLDIYGHLLPGAQDDIAEAIDELITPIEVAIDFQPGEQP